MYNYLLLLWWEKHNHHHIIIHWRNLGLSYLVCLIYTKLPTFHYNYSILCNAEIYPQACSHSVIVQSICNSELLSVNEWKFDQYAVTDGVTLVI